MEISSQVVSLELSKQLKETGYKQEGLWCSDLASHNPEKVRPIYSGIDLPHPDFVIRPTVAELGEALPSCVEVNEQAYYLRIWNGCGLWTISYMYQGKDYQWFNLHSVTDTEVNARAKMWLYDYNDGNVPDALKDGFLGFVRCGQSFDF